MLNDKMFMGDRKLRAALILGFCTFLLCGLITSAVAQDPPKAILVDEFANLFCSDDLRARLDYFYAALSEKPGSIGFVVANSDATIIGRFHKYFRMFQNHARFRGFDPDRIKYFRGPDSDSLHFQFWLVPDGAAPPAIPREFRQQPIKIPVLFDSSEITSVKRGVVGFGGDLGGEPCDFGLDINQFAIFLGADKNLLGYLVASSSGRRNRPKTRAALQLTAAKLKRQYRVPTDRIKIVFVGDRDNAEMQLWLVPKGNGPPAFQSRLP